ncbi:MAG TPA: DUF1598 domain-containing protein [Pirellulales bacterium]|nr:DUF1598 domain-containing protein [Pirellulales bacterium]
MLSRRYALAALLFAAWLSPALLPSSSPLDLGLRQACGCGGGTSTTNTNAAGAQAGIMISPGMVLDAASLRIDESGTASTTRATDPTGKLTRDRLQQAKAALNADIAKPSQIRKVSLTRLERAVQGQLERNRKPTDEMLRLAGLTRIRYVFFYPDSGDVVVAGPAEGWFQDLTGRFIGMVSSRPILELQDLVVALRAFAPGKDRDGVVGCSIDPTQEGLAKMQAFTREVANTIMKRQLAANELSSDDVNSIVDGIHNSLGLQKVSILGVSPETHFAQVMLEADYRMKLIGIGAEHSGLAKLKSYAELADASQIGRNALQRWWFVPDYKCVRVSDDHLAMELEGEGVKLVGEDEVVGPNGQRMAQGKSGRASQMFTHAFTQRYPELARRKPIYAQLRNLIDMVIAAAHIQREDYFGKAGWNLEVFGDESLFPVQVYKAPTEVDTVVTSIWKKQQLVTPVGGGVRIEAPMALESTNVLADEGNKVEKDRQEIQLRGLKPDQWWWD